MSPSWWLWSSATCCGRRVGPVIDRNPIGRPVREGAGFTLGWVLRDPFTDEDWPCPRRDRYRAQGSDADASRCSVSVFSSPDRVAVRAADLCPPELGLEPRIDPSDARQANVLACPARHPVVDDPYRWTHAVRPQRLGDVGVAAATGTTAGLLVVVRCRLAKPRASVDAQLPSLRLLTQFPTGRRGWFSRSRRGRGSCEIYPECPGPSPGPERTGCGTPGNPPCDTSAAASMPDTLPQRATEAQGSMARATAPTSAGAGADRNGQQSPPELTEFARRIGIEH